MSDEKKTTLFVWVKFIVGTILFAALMAIHVWVKELPVILFALPAALWGVDFSSFLGRTK